MRIAIGGWEFEVDISATEAYSAREAADHCDCAYCRNFYASVDEQYPDLRPFLAQFGVNMEAPDVLMPFDILGRMNYDSFYAVCGRIVTVGKLPLRIGKAEIRPGEFFDLDINTACSKPYFFLNISGVLLPWVLDEPMESVVSPANQPSFLRKMWARLLGKSRNNTPYS